MRMGYAPDDLIVFTDERKPPQVHVVPRSITDDDEI